MSTHNDLAHVRWLGVADPALPANRIFDTDDQFCSWFERDRLAELLLQRPAVQRAQEFCRAPCAWYVDDSAGHDQLPPLSLSLRSKEWLHDHIGCLYPVDASGQPVVNGDYLQVKVTMAYCLTGTSTIVLNQSQPVQVMAWAVRYAGGAGGVGISPTFSS